VTSLASRYPLLDAQVLRIGFWSAVVALVTGIVAMFIPLDVPAGYTAEHSARVAWLTANKGVFVVGWVNQIIAMLSLSGVFFATAWLIGDKNPLRAILAAMVVLLSVVAFIIPKFMAVWTLPVLAETISSGATGHAMADPLLRLLNVSVPFSLYTAFDYLGFWLYAVFGVLVAGPLFRRSMVIKITAVLFGVFGLVFHAMLVAYWMGKIAPADVEGAFLGPVLLLLVAVVLMLFGFKARANV